MLLLLAGGNPKQEEFYVDSIAVPASQRGGGIGTKLLRAAEERAAAMGKSKMSLHVVGDNEGGIRLYGRLGYRTAKREAGLLIRLATGSRFALKMEKQL